MVLCQTSDKLDNICVHVRAPELFFKYIFALLQGRTPQDKTKTQSTETSVCELLGRIHASTMIRNK